MDFDQPPVLRVEVEDRSSLMPGCWPLDIPAVTQVVADGLDLAPGVTFLVGENGSGKSKILESVAAVAVLETRFDTGGFYCLGEPEAALPSPRHSVSSRSSSVC